ncbi:uncharacterized protein PGRI_095690 [Penicillium griseofulvum]|uniref:Uncharacterized protein n=1 Tax=Penicillium patulum TaxID=5078 RepID=A0A135LUK0_PENPA|nr:uncharacterized protein PGRI_095690 [Penicillium griseofulvum]KXG52619.1 hypothetical protein PGRI_095690 [Penicillium griseofulvum]
MTRLTQAQVEEAEYKVFTYREEHFKMAARVDISRLVFDKNFKRQMSNRQNIARLERILDTQGCQRLMEECHVPVLIPESDWQRRVRPRLVDGQFHQLDVDIDYQLRGQDHENLIIAARKKLSSSNSWWIVDVYVTGQTAGEEPLQEEFVRSLQERFPNDQRPPDGLIYERIRYYEGYLDGPVNRIAANHWWAALERVPGSKKGKYLRAFLKHPTLPQAFDELLPIAGIWEGMRIGLLHKLVSMRCDEPLLCYLNHIKSTFFGLMGDRRDLLAQLDGVTIQLLKSRVPKVSARDLRFLEDRMSKEELFPDIEDVQDRTEIWERLKEIQYPIPTLETFFKDRISLEVGRSVLQQLYIPDPHRKMTVDEELGEQYYTSVPVMTSNRQHGIRGDLYDFWRFSFQYGFEMTDHKRRTRTKSGTQLAPTPVEELHERQKLWQHLFWLVREKGFSTPLVDGLPAHPVELSPITPCDYPASVEEDLPVERRNGTPYRDSVEADHFALSREVLERPWSSPRVTAGFARRSVFLAYFRYLKDDRDSQFVPEVETNEAVPQEPSLWNPNFDDLIQNTIIPPEENEATVFSVFSTPQFDPTSLAPAVDIQSPSRFNMKFIIPGEPDRDVPLPNIQSALNKFFEGFSKYHFHIYSRDNPTRGINGRDCYSLYVRNPFLLLHAEYVGADLSQTVLHESTDQEETRTSKKRRLNQNEQRELISAKEWLNMSLNELTQEISANRVDMDLPGGEDSIT